MEATAKACPRDFARSICFPRTSLDVAANRARTRLEMDHAFATRRIDKINDEISSVRAFEKSPALTKEGNLFLEKLFGS